MESKDEREERQESVAISNFMALSGGSFGSEENNRAKLNRAALTFQNDAHEKGTHEVNFVEYFPDHGVARHEIVREFWAWPHGVEQPRRPISC